jgi:hypothetical protein
MSYTYDTFLKPLSSTDTKIQIVDTIGYITHTINPFEVANSLASSKYLKISLKNHTVIDIPFSTQEEVKLALKNFNDHLSSLICGKKEFYDQVYYQFSHGQVDPLDGVSYFIGNLSDVPPQTSSSDSRKVKSKYKGTINIVTITTNIAGFLGSDEEQTFRINNITKGTSTLITDSYVNDTANKLDSYDLVVPLEVSVDDELEIEWVTPNFVTSPTSVRHYFNVYLLV